MEIDSDFGRIETFIKKREKIFVPSEYAHIIEITRPNIDPLILLELISLFLT
jgi:hypothetical protein